MDNLLNWLTENQLDKYADILQQNDITTVDLITELSEDDLKELGFSLGDRKRFTIAKKSLTSGAIPLSSQDLELINSLPYLIAYPLKQTLVEQHPWTKINLLKDTFLNYLKYLGLLSASEFFNSTIKDKGMVALFHKNLMETAFGKWNHYIRECLAFLKQQNHKFFYPELLAYYELVETGNKSKKYKGEIEYQDANGDTQLIVQTSITGIGMLINFRNRYLGHGLTLDAEQSEKLWNEYFPILRHLLEQLSFTSYYPMLKREHGETYLLHTAEMIAVESNTVSDSNIWIQNQQGSSFDILPFFIVPGEVSLAKEGKEQLLSYESYTGKTIKFFSPEGTEKQTSGKILEKLNLLLRDKQKETPFAPENFTKDEFLKRIAEENKLLLDTLISEKKIIPGIYQHREEIESKLREWIGAQSSIFFIVAEAGSGKTNLLAEIQKQYTDRQLPTLLIRAGRMEKQSLKPQINYLLNLDLAKDLNNYTSIAGTQAQPTFILIDGLNEANNAEEIWQEIIDLSKVFEPGSLKFVITNRANTKAELNRYRVSEKDEDLLFGENKNNETGLSAYSFWLTALDMIEMKATWENYATKDKAKFKPQFNFDSIAEFDRGIYNQINNPLILRLFLEIYNGKPLPKKGVKHLNIWHDWFKTFSAEEQLFLKLVANEVWQKGENELLLDDLLKQEVLKPYFTADIVNAPYNRLKSKGWISRYVKDLAGWLGYTVEGALLYILALQLQEQKPALDLADLQSLFNNGSILKKSAIEAFLCEQALNEDLNLVIDLIDSGNEYIDISIKPLLLFLKTFGVERTVHKMLEKPTENDWKALNKLDDQVNKLELHVLRKEFLTALMPQNTLKTKEALALGLKAIAILNKNEAINYLNKIDTTAPFIAEDVDLLFQLGICESKFANYDKALTYYTKNLDILIKTLGENHTDVASLYSKMGEAFYKKGEYNKALGYFDKSLSLLLKTMGDDHHKVAGPYNDIGMTWSVKGDYNKSLENHNKSLAIKLKTLGGEHPDVANSYSNIGSVLNKKGEIEKALEYFTMCLTIRLKTLGQEHPLVAVSYGNIGNIWKGKANFDKALEYFEKSLAIKLYTLGGEHPDVATSYNNIGQVWNKKGDYDKALEYYTKCLALKLKTLGGEHPHVATSYNNIGSVWKSKGSYDKALEYYKSCLEIELKTKGGEHPDVATSYNNIGQVWESKGENEKALEYFEKSLPIKLKNLGGQHPSVAITYGNIGQVWMKKGEYDKAQEYYTKSLTIRLTIMGGGHPSVGTSYSNIGSVLNNKGEYDKALEYFEKCLEIELKTLGVDHPSVGTSYSNIGSVWMKKAEYDKALEYYTNSLAIKLKTLGEEHPDVGASYYNIGKIYESKAAFETALTYYIYSSQIRFKKLGASHNLTIKSIESAKHMALQLNKEYELPEWLKEMK